MKQFYFLVLLSFILLSSCVKENVLEKKDAVGANSKVQKLAATSPLPTTNDNGNRLVFATQASLDAFLSAAMLQSDPDLVRNSVLSTAPNFKFYTGLSQFSDGRTRTENDEDGFIDDPFFAAVINDKGEIQVENTIYKVVKYGTFAVTESQIDALNTTYAGSERSLRTTLTNMTVVDEDNGLYKINNDIYFMDTYAYKRMGGFTRTSAASTQSANDPFNPDVPPTMIKYPIQGSVPNTPPTPPNIVFSNMDVFQFNSKYTIAGKFIQNIFGDPQYKSFAQTPNKRLKVNFYSKNWFIFSSLGVKASVQTRVNYFAGIYGWKADGNVEEMRLGWTPIVVKLDIPSFTIPGTSAPQDPFTVAGKMTKSLFKIKMNDEDYNVISVSDILDADDTFYFLPQGWRTTIGNFSFNVSAALKNLADGRVDALFKNLKTQIGYTGPGNLLAITNYDKLMIEDGVKIQYGVKGKMSKTFTWNTAIVGFKNSGFVFSASKPVNMMGGGVYAAAKVNGEWVGIGVVKDNQ